MVDSLVKLRLARQRQLAPQSAAYLCLQRYAACFADGEPFQFRIVSRDPAAPSDAPAVLFLSETHAA
jgi:hypothetical protein